MVSSLWVSSRQQWDSEMLTVSRVWSFIPGTFQKTEIIMRTLLWSTPVTWGTNHRGLVSTGTCSDLLPFGVEKATRFSKCNPLHILYIIAQVETFGCHLLFATMFAFYTVRLSLLEPNFCLAGPMGDMALPNLNLPTILEEVWPKQVVQKGSLGHITSYNLFWGESVFCASKTALFRRPSTYLLPTVAKLPPNLAALNSISQFVWVNNPGMASLAVSASRCPWATVRVSPGLQHLRAQPGSVPCFPSWLMWLLARLFPWDCWTEFLAGCWPEASPSFWPQGPHKRAAYNTALFPSEWANDSLKENSGDGNHSLWWLNSEVTSH